MRPGHEFPWNILQETYRPLTFFASELLLAVSPLLPAFAIAWAKRIEAGKTTTTPDV